MTPKLFSLLLITLVAVSFVSAAAVSIGVNYGALADNLPPSSQVTAFLKSCTFIYCVKLFDCNPDFIRAFAGTGIFVAITAPTAPSSRHPGWRLLLDPVQRPPLPSRHKHNLVFVGNELMAAADRNLIAHHVLARSSVKSTLSSAGHPQIHVSTPPTPSASLTPMETAEAEETAARVMRRREEFGGHYGND